MIIFLPRISEKAELNAPFCEGKTDNILGLNVNTAAFPL